MKLIRILFLALLGGISLLALGATLAHAGLSRTDPASNLMLRQESRAPGQPGFFAGRAHRGGGLHGGK